MTAAFPFLQGPGAGAEDDPGWPACCWGRLNGTHLYTPACCGGGGTATVDAAEFTEAFDEIGKL